MSTAIAEPAIELPAGIRTGATQADFPKWLAEHGTGIGGSEAAAIMGQSPWKSALEVYVEKTEPAKLDDNVGEAALWGRLFEEPMIMEFARRTNRDIQMGGELVRSREHEHMICTLDALQQPSGKWGKGDTYGLVEGKTTALGHRYPKPGSDEEIPVEVQIQVQHCFVVTGLTWGDVVWLPLPERRLQWREQFANDDFARMLIDQVAVFWKRMEDRNPPPPDGSDSAGRALAAMYGNPDGESMVLSDHELDLQKELSGLASTRKNIEDREKEIKQDIRSTMRDFEFGSLPDGSSFSLKQQTRRGTPCDECGHSKAGKPFRVLRHRKSKAATRGMK